MVAVVGKAVAGAMAGEQLVKDPSSTTAWHKTSAENKNTRLDRGQDNGELGDMSQQYGTTLDTALTISPRRRYDMANRANTNTLLGPVYTKIELKASTQTFQEPSRIPTSEIDR